MKMRVKINQEEYEVDIQNLNNRPILAAVDGQVFEVWPEEGALPEVVKAAPAPKVEAAPAAAAPAPAPKPAAPATGDKSKLVTAPIPGVIISVLVKEGEEVAANQELCILEAMKMKNTIKATRAGKIGAVLVSAGENVKHSQPLFEYAD